MPLPVLQSFLTLTSHIPDWLNEKLLQEERSQLSLPRAKDSNKHSNNVFQQFKSKNQSIDLIRQVANGFKHLSSDMPETTATGWGRGYGLSCGESRFLIEKNIRADVLCEEVLAYWHKILTPILTDRVTIGK